MFGEQQRFMLFLIAPAALLLLLFQVLPIAIHRRTGNEFPRCHAR